MVPEPSERWTAWMPDPGRAALGFSALMAGSFHLVIPPAKMAARASGVAGLTGGAAARGGARPVFGRCGRYAVAAASAGSPALPYRDRLSSL